jgi:hypothetical protein
VVIWKGLPQFNGASGQLTRLLFSCLVQYRCRILQQLQTAELFSSSCALSVSVFERHRLRVPGQLDQASSFRVNKSPDGAEHFAEAMDVRRYRRTGSSGLLRLIQPVDVLRAVPTHKGNSRFLPFGRGGIGFARKHLFPKPLNQRTPDIGFAVKAPGRTMTPGNEILTSLCYLHVLGPQLF